ncbi:MAG: TIR domain-containing protein [Verrucomicrobiota bacterium]
MPTPSKINKAELKRIIGAFESESAKFHDVTFTTFLVHNGVPSAIRRFHPSNHTIMLWQYYGSMSAKDGAGEFVNDLKSSDLKWGLRGAQVTLFAVLEGDQHTLFVRMAQRAAAVLRTEDVMTVKTRVVDEVAKKAAQEGAKPVTVTNDNLLAVWLNYLLFFISKVYPDKATIGTISPDPFVLSLLALESMQETETVVKADKSSSQIESLRFRVALSFPGERRPYVSKVAAILRKKLGRDSVFYDFDYQSQLARPNLDLLLQNIYRKQSHLLVVFLSCEYAKKDWCGLEWRAIRDIIKSREDDKIMFVRFDDTPIDGLFSIDGYVDGARFTPAAVAKMITDRLPSA